MRTSLLLTLSVMAAACAGPPRQGDVHTHPTKTRTASKTPTQMPPEATAYAGPTPVVRPPLPTYTPPGAGAPAVGQPGYPGQGVQRSKDPRVLPPSPYPAIYAASGDGRRPVVRGIRPKSATDKEAWEECERRVAEAVTDPATFSQELVAKAKRLSDLNWKCAQEHAMTVCYLHLTAATNDERGFLRAASSENGSAFRDEMGKRKEQVCKGKDKNTQDVIAAVIERGRLYDWKTASNPANLNKSILPEGQRLAMENEAANRAYREKQQRQAAARMRTITTGRTTARLPSMAGYEIPMPERILNACWGATQQCMDGLGADVQALPDAVYECVRWGAVNQCSRQALSAAMRAAKLQGWGSPWDVMQFHKDVMAQHCPKPWDAKWDAYFDRIQNKCHARFESAFK